jgi:2-oxoglutarate ferredoxin oxidoreductase subunit alpha
MKRQDFSWMIGGAQGSGVDTSANIFARAAAQGGYHVFGKREYYSNIKGEHSYFQVRVSQKVIRSHVDTVDMLASFDEETVFRHALEVRRDGAIVYDPDLRTKKIDDVPTIERNVRDSIKKILSQEGLGLTMQDVLELARKRGVHLYPVPYTDLLKQVGQKFGEGSLSSLSRMTNVMAVAASYALLSFDSSILKESIARVFRLKQKVVEMNQAAVDVVYSFVSEKYDGSFGYKLSPLKIDEKRIFMRGNVTVGIAKELAGCRLQTYYPITPASDESEYLEAHEIIDLDGYSNDPQIAEQQVMKNGSIVVVQTEDEIAAITMAIGGGLAGVRSATSTSGPGFSLMAEGLGWAGMNEVPVVVTLYQRAGPSTGMPTRHEQGDLKFALNTGHGEFPRIVLASGDLEEVFYDTVRAFNYAEKYQTPVIHVIDKALANSDTTLPMLDTSKVKIERGATIVGRYEQKDGIEFSRFQYTETGVSPRPVIGTKGVVYWLTGDEHDEFGHISEDPSNRRMMMEKRMKKLEMADKEIPLTEKVNFFGPEDAEITVLSWGSTKGAILDAMEWLEEDGISVNFLQIRLINPFPTDYVSKVLSRARNIVDVEMNYSGQLAGITREKTCIPIEKLIVKYNGRPMSCEEVYSALKSFVEGKAQRRVVLTNGS